MAERFGTDFGRGGVVMDTREVENQRRKRGECITCGQKCFQKKLLRMVPITEDGAVLNGRCLKCKPITSGGDDAVVPVQAPAKTPVGRDAMQRFTESQRNLNITAGPGSGGKSFNQRKANRRASNDAQATSSSSSGRAGRTMGRQQSTATISSSGGSITAPGSGDASQHSVPPHARDHSVERSLQQSQQSQQPLPTVSPLRGQEPRMQSLPPQLGPRGAYHGSGGGGAEMPLPVDPSPYGDSNSYRSNISNGGRSYHETQGHEHYPGEYDHYNVERRRSSDDLNDLQHQSGQRINPDEAYMQSHPAASALIDYYRESYRNQGDFRDSSRSLNSTNSHHSYSTHHSTRQGGSSHHSRMPVEEPYAYGQESEQSLLNRGGAVPFDGAASVSSGSTRSLRSNRDSWQGSHRQLLDSSRSVESNSTFSGDHDGDVMSGAPGTPSRLPPGKMDHFNRYGGDELSQSNHSGDDMSHRSHASRSTQVTHTTQTSHTRGSGGGVPQYSSARELMESHTSSSMLSMTVASRDNAGMERIQAAGADFVEIVTVMRDFSDSAAVLLTGMQELSNLQLSAQDMETFIHIGAVEVIVQGMGNFPADVELQISGCRAMWNASATSGSQMAFVAAGALDVIHRGMNQYLDDADVQEQSMATLANLGAIETNVGIMIERNIATSIVEAMNKHADNVHVQKKGCSAITNMASHNTPFKKTIMEMGGGGAVVIAMVMHPNDFVLQERALRALRNLSANCDENKVELANIGGIDAVISAMQVHRDSHGVQESGAWTLSNLAGNPDNKVMIGDYGGIDVVIRAMWVHSDNEKVQEWCARALFTLSIDRHNGNLIQEVGGISAIVNAMQAHVDSVVIQEMGCAVLCNLATDKTCKMRIVDEEALDAIVLAMVLHSEDAKVQERGCQVLTQLTILENCKAMQASNIGELFRAAADRFPEHCADLADRYLRTMDHFVSQYNNANP